MSIQRRQKLDQYPTPPRALLNALPLLGFDNYELEGMEVLEPCAGAGNLVKVLRFKKARVLTNDLAKKYHTQWHLDATERELYRKAVARADGLQLILTNPPYNQASEILSRAWVNTSADVILLVRVTWLEPCPGRANLLRLLAKNLSHLVVLGQPRPAFVFNKRLGRPAADSATSVWCRWARNHGGGTRVSFLTGWQTSEEE